MRSTLSHAQFLSYEDEHGIYTIYGVCLGADFVAEHEWGIDRLKDLFHIDSDLIGLPGRTAQRGIGEPHLFYGETKEHGVLLVSANGLKTDDLRVTSVLKQRLSHYELYPESHDPSCAWDERSFGITSCDKDFLEKLHKAIEKGDVALYFYRQHDNPFARAGLCVTIASLVPEEVKTLLKDADENARALKEAAEATGIYAKLRIVNGDKMFSAPKGYYALKPRWANESDRETAHPVIFWLNPMRQEIHEAGWFTVEELEEWIEDRGPVMKVKVEEKVYY